MTGALPNVDETHEPPPSTTRVLVIGLVGVALVFLSFLVGPLTGAPLRGFDTHWADGLRAFLSVLGLLVTGCAVSMHPRWYGGWLCGAAAGLLGYGIGAPPPSGTEWYLSPPRNWYAGLPNSWDSVQLFFGVMGLIGLVGAIWTRLPKKVVLILMLIGVAYHFAAILSMITSPAPAPWLTIQYSGRVSRNYTQFAYFSNAYQFYSPDPGPACELWVCIEYRPLKPGEKQGDPVDAQELRDLEGADDPDAPKDCEWILIPKRQQHYLDPLGLSFYRRLSITENVAHVQGPNYVPLAKEQENVLARRAHAQDFVPRLYPNDPNGVNIERRVPNDVISRQVLPSYARHLSFANARPEKQVRSIRIYRALHVIPTLAQFRGYDVNLGKDVPPMSPYHHTSYMPYFMGRFNRDGKLIDSTDQLLYWLIPIVQDRQIPDDPAEYRRNGGFNHYFTDYVSRHAGCDRPIKE